MERFFIRIYDYFEKHRPVFYAIFLLSFLISGWFAFHLRFEEDISKVLPKDRNVEKLNQVFQNSRFTDRLVVMVARKDSAAAAEPDSLVAYTKAFVQEINQKLSPYIRSVNDRVDEEVTLNLFRTVRDHLPVFLSKKDYQTIDSLLVPERIRETLRNDFNTLNSPAGIALKQMISQDPVGITFLGLQKFRQLQYDDNFELYDGYVMTRDHRHLLFFITPAYPPNNTGKNAVLLEGIDAIADSLTNQSHVEATYFGAVAVSVGNALQLRKDTLVTQGITVVFLFFFIGLYFRKKRAPFIILIPVLFGSLFALAAVYFIKGSISVIALGSGSVVLGVAVNYSLHLFNHRRHTHHMREVIQDLTIPLTVGSFTTIGGFLCLEFVQSDMLKDLGLFAAFSLIGASLCTLIFLPHLFGSGDRQEQPGFRFTSFIDRLAAYRPEFNKYLVILIILLTVVFGYTANWVGFESDLSRMNYMSPKLKEAENNLNKINVLSLQSVYLVSEGKTLQQALTNSEELAEKVEDLRTKGIVKKYSGVSSVILSDSLQQAKIRRWNTYWTGQKKDSVIQLLKMEGAALKFRPAAFDGFRSLLDKNYEPVDTPSMNLLRTTFVDDYITENPGNSTVVTLVKVAPADKDSVYRAFENNPTVSVLDRQYLTNKFIGLINADFSSIAWMTSILVFTVLLITYGRIELTLVSFIPMFITFIWVLGIMGILGVRFNVINIIISAFIFGLGDDYSLFIMDGLLQEYKTGRKNLPSYKSSIFLSAITTIAGLGVLIFAKHPALRSIAIISIVGIVCVVIMSQIIIPFLYRTLIQKRTEMKRFPWTLSGFLKSAFAFTYFAVGSLLLTIAGFLLVKCNPFNKEGGKYLYHILISKFCWSLMYIMINVKKTIINSYGERFSRPAIIVCNHQSFLDILVTVMLHPRLILFTNHWVWKSPVFGAVVRMADYYPIMHGLESSLDLLEGRIRQGYSIVVFPEGTRSADGDMKRFHKGAFYLAEKLNLDILPIMIHGTGYTMSKGDFLLKDGSITVKFLPRIRPRDTGFGDGYAERAKLIGRYFRQQYNLFRGELEQPPYFREQLIYNYLYKGPVIEWYMKIKLRLEKNYKIFHRLLPTRGHIIDIGCGYGFMSYMLHFASPGRRITGIDHDEMKTTVASHCFSKDENIRFIHADINSHPLGKYDGIVLSDVLHYLQQDDQKALLDRCLAGLCPGGVLVIRDANADLPSRHRGSRLTEFFSTRLFGFNKTSGQGLSFFSAKIIREAAVTRNMEYTEIDNTRYTSNQIHVIKNNQASVHGPV